MLGSSGRSFKIFTWLNIPVYLHWSFFLIFLYPLYFGYSKGFPPVTIAWLMVFFVCLFGCVLLHEYGHALAARRYGVSTHDIILMPLGGMARLARIPELPLQEFIVAIAGPLVNAIIAIVLYVFGRLAFTGDTQELFSYYMQQEPNMAIQGLYMFIPLLIWTNASLFIFNLIPAFPMDGGRIFRSLMALPFGRVRATKYATWLGQFMAVLFIGFGLYTQNFILSLIGVFVITTARSEYRFVRTNALLRNRQASEIMRTSFTRMYTNDWMQSAAELLRSGHEHSFLVYNYDQQPVGILKEADIIQCIKQNRLSTTVQEHMDQQMPIIPAQTNLEYVYQLLNQQGADLVLVRDHYGAIIGVIDDMSMDYFMELQEKTELK